MISFKSVLEKFDAMGEKTGWTYFRVSQKIAGKIKPGTKKSFRVKGKLDDHSIKGVALIPMGDGEFIMAVNAAMRKALKKIHGASINVQLEEDRAAFKLSAEMLTCLKDDPDALQHFTSLPPSHQHWFSNWVTAAKTDLTRSKRIAAIVKSCSLKMTFGEMMRQYRDERKLIQ